MEIKLKDQVRGTRLLTGILASRRRLVLNWLITRAAEEGAEEIFLPSLEPLSVYTDKTGPEVEAQTYNFQDRSGRNLVLRPEGTATCQLLAKSTWKYERDKMVWYETRCWRYERPQAGRYREFTQFGIEILNPRAPAQTRLKLGKLAVEMVQAFTTKFQYNPSVKRGLAYYTEDGFEISCPELGAQSQVCGGGSYKEGCGFAFGVDRLMMLS